MSKSEPKITIVTAVWRLEGLKKVIEVVDNQTYKEWQHIIVNDNHPDIREYLRRYADGDYWGSKRHWIDFGVRTHWFGGYARNVGAMVSFIYRRQGHRDEENEWICFLDDDNLWYPDHLETFVKANQEKPEATLLGVDMERRGYQDRSYKEIVKCSIDPNFCDLGNFLYKKKLFEKYGYFLPRRNRKITFDFELIKKMADGEGEDKICIVHKPTFIYYHRKR